MEEAEDKEEAEEAVGRQRTMAVQREAEKPPAKKDGAPAGEDSLPISIRVCPHPYLPVHFPRDNG